METSQILIIVLTGIIAATTITYTLVTASLLRATQKSVDLTRRTLILSAMIREAELDFLETEKNPDGSSRFGASKSAPRDQLHEYQQQIKEFREQMEQLK